MQYLNILQTLKDDTLLGIIPTACTFLLKIDPAGVDLNFGLRHTAGFWISMLLGLILFVCTALQASENQLSWCWLHLFELLWKLTCWAWPQLQLISFCKHCKINPYGVNLKWLDNSAGIGKSTLLGLISGSLEPTKGTITRNAKVRMAVFSQHHVDGLDLALTPLAYMLASFPNTKDQEHRWGTIPWPVSVSLWSKIGRYKVAYSQHYVCDLHLALIPLASMLAAFANNQDQKHRRASWLELCHSPSDPKLATTNLHLPSTVLMMLT